MKSAAAIRLIEMPKEPVDSIQVSVRIPTAWVEELDALATTMSRPGIELARADLLRATIARGIKELRAELKPKPKR
jgi:hypothetical protein